MRNSILKAVVFMFCMTDSVLVAAEQKAPLEALFPPGKGKRSVRILFESEGDKPVGLTAPVSVLPSGAAK